MTKLNKMGKIQESFGKFEILSMAIENLMTFQAYE
jgi:hypothetical protein